LLCQQEATLSLFRKKNKRHRGVVGVTFFSDGLALVLLEQDSDAVVELKLACSESCAATEHAQVLSDLVSRHQLQNVPCAAVMARGTYNLIQVDKPAVPENELRDAVRWQIKDLLDFPAEEAVIDVFSGYGTEAVSTTFTVAAAEAKVGYVVDALRGAGLNLKAIDIPELALRNILAKSDENERGVALLSLFRDNGLITIVRGGELCMARRINLGSAELVAASGDENIDGVEISEAQQNILDGMVLEIQRSLDYYESSVSRQSVSALLIAPLLEPVPGLHDYLNSYLTPEVRELDLQKWLGGESMSDIEQSRCLAAIGVGLRSGLN